MPMHQNAPKNDRRRNTEWDHSTDPEDRFRILK